MEILLIDVKEFTMQREKLLRRKHFEKVYLQTVLQQ